MISILLPAYKGGIQVFKIALSWQNEVLLERALLGQTDQ